MSEGKRRTVHAEAWVLEVVDALVHASDNIIVKFLLYRVHDLEVGGNLISLRLRRRCRTGSALVQDIGAVKRFTVVQRHNVLV